MVYKSTLVLSLKYFFFFFIWDLISSLLTSMVLYIFLYACNLFFSFTRGSIEVLKSLTTDLPVNCGGSCVWVLLGLVLWLVFGGFLCLTF